MSDDKPKRKKGQPYQRMRRKGQRQPTQLVGKSKPRQTDAAVIKALLKSNGNIAAAARALGYEACSLRVRICTNPMLRDAKNEIREAKLDLAEDKLDDHIYNKQSLPALLEYLKAVGKHRGYGSSIDVNLAAQVNHSADDAILGGLLEKFEKKLNEDADSGK